MDSLQRLLGPAPSELPFDELLETLSFERDRMRRNLIWFQNNAKAPRKPTKVKGKKGGGKALGLATRAKREGVSLDEIAQAIEILKKQKGLV